MRLIRANAARIRARRAMALVTSLWWVVGVSLVVLITFQWALHQRNIERKIFGATDHLYLSEGILAKEIQRLKRTPWDGRWYKTAERVTSGVPGAAILGTFGEADYMGYVQDVSDFWSKRRGALLGDHTDLFLKVTYPRGRPDATSRHYFCRLVFRRPSQQRPRAFFVRRFGRVAEFDPAEDRDRAMVVARVNRAEREREVSRPATNVNVRYARHLLGKGMPIQAVADALIKAEEMSLARSVAGGSGSFGAILDRLAREVRPRAANAGVGQDERAREAGRPDSNVLGRESVGNGRTALLTRQIVADLMASGFRDQRRLEARILSKIREGDAIFYQPPIPTGQLAVATGCYEDALGLAKLQNAVNRVETISRCLYRIAASRTLEAQKKPYDLLDECARLRTPRSAAPTRTDLLKSVQDDCYRRIIREFPQSVEAPHSYVPWAWAEMKKVPMAQAVAWSSALQRAYAVLEMLRNEYPGHRLWGEDAITGSVHGGDARPEDEVVFWTKGQIRPRVIGANGLVNCYVVAGDPPDGSNPQPLFPGSAFSQTRLPCPSPDGTQVAFEGYVDGAWDVYISDMSDGSIRRLTFDRRGVGFNVNPLFSPLGDRIAFHSNVSGRFEIHTLSPDGSDRKQLTGVTRNDGCNTCPDWSPDGRFVAFISDRRTPNGFLNRGWASVGGEVWIMGADGSNPRRVTTENGPLWWQYCPAFSPDGDRIAFSRWRSTSATRPWVISSSLWVVNIDREGTPLPPEPGRTNPYPVVGVPPADSPEGTFVNDIVWSQDPAVLVMNFDGNSSRIVTLDRSGQRAENVAFLGGLIARSAYRFRCFVPGFLSQPLAVSCPGAGL